MEEENLEGAELAKERGTHYTVFSVLKGEEELCRNSQYPISEGDGTAVNHEPDFGIVLRRRG